MDSKNEVPTLDSPYPLVNESGIVELEMHRHPSLLLKIEVASCFRGQPEPLFRDLSPIIYSFQRFSAEDLLWPIAPSTSTCFRHLLQTTMHTATGTRLRGIEMSPGKQIWFHSVGARGVPRTPDSRQPPIRRKVCSKTRRCTWNTARWWMMEHQTFQCYGAWCL